MQLYFSMSQAEDVGDGVEDDFWRQTLWSAVASKTIASTLSSVDGVQMANCGSHYGHDVEVTFHHSILMFF